LLFVKNSVFFINKKKHFFLKFSDIFFIFVKKERKVMKTSFGPQRLFFPMPVCLIVTGTLEAANVATIAWVSLLTSKPPSIGISVGNKGLTAQQILKNRNFTVNIAGTDIMTEADFCGITSGKDTDKFALSGLNKMASNIVAAPIIKECPVNLECELVQQGKIGTTYHFVGEIKELHIDTDKLFDTSDYTAFNLDLLSPLIYIGGAKEYRMLGAKIGDAYEIGKKILGA